MLDESRKLCKQLLNQADKDVTNAERYHQAVDLLHSVANLSRHREDPVHGELPEISYFPPFSVTFHYDGVVVTITNEGCYLGDYSDKPPYLIAGDDMAPVVALLVLNRRAKGDNTVYVLESENTWGEPSSGIHGIYDNPTAASAAHRQWLDQDPHEDYYQTLTEWPVSGGN